jgi:hypothetical protein
MPVNWDSNSYCPTLFMPTGEKVKFYRYFGVQIPSPAYPLEQTKYDDIIDRIKDVMRN